MRLFQAAPLNELNMIATVGRVPAKRVAVPNNLSDLYPLLRSAASMGVERESDFNGIYQRRLHGACPINRAATDTKRRSMDNVTCRL